MEEISYKLLEFEGPLDLLLSLISKNKLNIYDIEISVLLEQYLEHIKTINEKNPDISSEFLEMAARLVYLKTISLLPKHNESEEFKEELVGELIEYRDCKKTAGILFNMLNLDLFTRDALEIEFSDEYNRIHNVNEIVEAYKFCFGKSNPKNSIKNEVFSEIVYKKIVSVSSKIIFILKLLFKTKEISYNDIFLKCNEKSDKIATFLALLELIKANRVILDDDYKIKIIKRRSAKCK